MKSEKEFCRGSFHYQDKDGNLVFRIDELISASPEVIDVEVIRRSVWDTELEKVVLYRYRLKMSDS